MSASFDADTLAWYGESLALFAEACRLFEAMREEADPDVSAEMRAQHSRVAEQHRAVISRRDFGRC